MSYNLAQINIARLLAPIDSPQLAEFTTNLDRINDIAEQSKGFVWRLKDDSNNATSFNPFNDDKIIVNVSVWESIEDLKTFAFRTEHVEFYLKRANWFERMTEAHMALWWVKKDEFSTAEEGRNRLLYLREHGDTDYAFSFKKIFEMPV
jgi:Domain of unknown function (DUF3291)